MLRPLKDRLKRYDPQKLPNWVKPVLDLTLWLLAALLAFSFRYDGRIPAASVPGMLLFTAILLTAKGLGARLLRLHQQSWSRVSFRDLGGLLRLSVSVGILGSLILLLVGPAIQVPRSVAVLDMILSLSLMTGARVASRYWHENFLEHEVVPSKRKRVLIVGAGEAGAMIGREMMRHPEMGIKPVGFLDDDIRKVGQRIATIPVLGTLKDLDMVLGKLAIDEVLIAIPSASGKVVRQIVDKIDTHKFPVTYRIIPGMYELLSGKVDIKRIREVEIQDLLGRTPVKLDTNSILGYLEGKVVMITGAGGSIGSEIVRQVCRFRPKELILFGHGENSIYQLERELDRDWPDIKYSSVIGAIQNGVRLDYVFRRYKPEVIFHTAAHKHVPLMELNPEEAVFNNIVGTKNLVNLAIKYGVSHFVNISTDKAVNPTSVMGASKRMVEFIVQDAAKRAREGQTFVSVRFGNVLGSRGSVIPVFKQQIAAGGPVTVTHPDMVRYFMTIPEASQLVLQASAQGKNGDIYILDMGEPVKIVDLARDLIKLSGFEPDVDIPIAFSGMRPGEKMFEELMTPEEQGNETVHEKIFIARVQPFSSEALEATLHELQEAALQSDHLRIRHVLESFIEGCRFDYSRLPIEA
jgi:FlaA1/EpsC-like NDP-sugar epimerase